MIVSCLPEPKFPSRLVRRDAPELEVKFKIAQKRMQSVPREKRPESRERVDDGHQLEARPNVAGASRRTPTKRLP